MQVLYMERAVTAVQADAPVTNGTPKPIVGIFVGIFSQKYFIIVLFQIFI